MRKVTLSKVKQLVLVRKKVLKQMAVIHFSKAKQLVLVL